jgi:hypothetical protein
MTEAKKSYTKVRTGHFATRVEEEAERRAQDSGSEEYDWGCNSDILHQPGASPPINKEKAKRPKFSGTRRSIAQGSILPVEGKNVATTGLKPPLSPKVASSPPSSPPQSPTILERMMSFGSSKPTSDDTSHNSQNVHYLSDYVVNVTANSIQSTLVRRDTTDKYTL